VLSIHVDSIDSKLESGIATEHWCNPMRSSEHYQALSGTFSRRSWQESASYALIVMFLFTATAHFNKMKHDLARMIPPYFPHPLLIVYITGILELLGAAGLALPQSRRLAGICLIALLVGMFIANVNAAQKGITLRGKPPTPLWLRTLMQILFIALLWWSTRA
jgi:uncharacterized membrane protein